MCIFFLPIYSEKNKNFTTAPYSFSISKPVKAISVIYLIEQWIS